MLCGSGSPSNLSITVTSVATATISAIRCLPIAAMLRRFRYPYRPNHWRGYIQHQPCKPDLTINTSTGAITPSSSSTAGTYTVIYAYTADPALHNGNDHCNHFRTSHRYSQCQSCHYLYRAVLHN